ncbi:hypothetical protein SGLAD_v1c03540 [Spiroplasma gladiatoris]|uniref:Uncharacterized protein n=1 Tax=Spiroplasma gladiatoris TaxID=2143 RepID=A0A4P7AIL1_9MOLU|nr:hypothetical protein [Spiroplasma gladiatoris]QBQ07553.1 hypothetical protein SGLAD_v1c03540 [Spiroplasma gladiatoris]
MNKDKEKLKDLIKEIKSAARDCKMNCKNASIECEGKKAIHYIIGNYHFCDDLINKCDCKYHKKVYKLKEELSKEVKKYTSINIEEAFKDFNFKRKNKNKDSFKYKPKDKTSVYKEHLIKLINKVSGKCENFLEEFKDFNELFDDFKEESLNQIRQLQPLQKLIKNFEKISTKFDVIEEYFDAIEDIVEDVEDLLDEDYEVHYENDNTDTDDIEDTDDTDTIRIY